MFARVSEKRVCACSCLRDGFSDHHCLKRDPANDQSFMFFGDSFLTAEISSFSTQTEDPFLSKKIKDCEKQKDLS